MTREDPNEAARRYTRESFSIAGNGVDGFAAGMAGIVLLLVGLAFSNRFDGPLHAVVRVMAIVLAVGVPALALGLLGRAARWIRSR